MSSGGNFKPGVQDPRRGKGGKREGAGRKSNQKKADEAEATRLFRERLAASFDNYFDLMDKLCKGVKVRKFYPAHHPTNPGKVYYETEYDTATLRFLIERFIPPAKTAMDVNVNKGYDALIQKFAEDERREWEARETDPDKAH